VLLESLGATVAAGFVTSAPESLDLGARFALVHPVAAQWEAGLGSVMSGRSVWLSVGGGLTLVAAVDPVGV
jgi:hypothetical protein